MKFENVLEELKTLQNTLPEICEKIKSHNLPVIVLGAAGMAGQTTKILKSNNIEIAGYAIDANFYKPNKIFLGLPVYNFEDLRLTPDKYVFVLGFIGHSKSRIIDFLNDSKITKYAFTLGNFTPEFDCNYILANCEKFAETFYWLSDELSKMTFIAFLKMKITHDIKYAAEVYHPNQYFNEVTNGFVTPFFRGGAFLDCGAYRGDTVETFIKWSGGSYEKIFAVEADSSNFAELEKFIRAKNYENVIPINCGVWKEKTTLVFSDSDGQMSTVDDEGSVRIKADKIDNISSGEKINFIKMDIEGAELSALQGAVETIKRDRPTLAICAYHKSEDLITLPQFIKNLNPGYKLYLRHHAYANDWEMVLYAVP